MPRFHMAESVTSIAKEPVQFDAHNVKYTAASQLGYLRSLRSLTQLQLPINATLPDYLDKLKVIQLAIEPDLLFLAFQADILFPSADTAISDCSVGFLAGFFHGSSMR